MYGVCNLNWYLQVAVYCVSLMYCIGLSTKFSTYSCSTKFIFHAGTKFNYLVLSKFSLLLNSTVLHLDLVYLCE